MEATTNIYVSTGLALWALVLNLVNWRYKQRQRPENGHDRAERRKLEWHQNLYRIEKIPVESPLSEGK
jgi:hypothetical protein